MTKLTKEQIEHYLKGGMFLAKYNPKEVYDLSAEARLYIGNELIVYQNMIIAPIQEAPKYEGQHAFNAREIHGWFPEEDIEIIRILEEYLDDPESLPQYLYRLHYSTREQLTGNFGNAGKTMDLPFHVGRSYSFENDRYVIGLSTPQADKIEKAIYTGETEELHWEAILEHASSVGI